MTVIFATEAMKVNIIDVLHDHASIVYTSSFLTEFTYHTHTKNRARKLLGGGEGARQQASTHELASIISGQSKATK